MNGMVRTFENFDEAKEAFEKVYGCLSESNGEINRINDHAFTYVDNFKTYNDTYFKIPLYCTLRKIEDTEKYQITLEISVGFITHSWVIGRLMELIDVFNEEEYMLDIDEEDI